MKLTLWVLVGVLLAVAAIAIVWLVAGGPDDCLVQPLSPDQARYLQV